MTPETERARRPQRPLGNPIDKARAAGAQAAAGGASIWSNPYKRRPQHDAWERAYRRERAALAAAEKERG